MKVIRVEVATDKEGAGAMSPDPGAVTTTCLSRGRGGQEVKIIIIIVHFKSYVKLMTFSANPFLSSPLSNDDGCFSSFKSRLQAHAVS